MVEASERLGTYTPKEDDKQVAERTFAVSNINTDGTLEEELTSTQSLQMAIVDNLSHYVGNRSYEGKNHLGNVLVVFTDAKESFDRNNDGLIDAYEAVVINASDYYPFGSPMPNRKFSGVSYRYGFQSAERDDEIYGGGSAYDFGARIYSSRLGRWMSTDPLFHIYPEFSPYAFVANSPIQFYEVGGMGFNGGFSITNKSTTAVTVVGSSAIEVTTTTKAYNPYSPGWETTSRKFVDEKPDVVTLEPGQRLEVYTEEISNSDGEKKVKYTARVVQFAELKDGKLVNLDNEVIVKKDVDAWDVDYIDLGAGQTYVDDDGQKWNSDVTDKDAKTPNPGTGEGTIKIRPSIFDYSPDGDDANEGNVTITGNDNALKLESDGQWENQPVIKTGDGVTH